MRLHIIKSLLIGTVLAVLPQVSFASTSITIDSLVRFTGPTINANVGGAVVLGDVNGDGYDDMVMGAYIDGDSVPGSAYLIYGTADQASSLTISAANAITFSGTSADDQVGTSLAMGDLNNDGFDDIVIGAKKDDTSATDAGRVSIVYGGATTLSATAISNLPGLTGENASDLAGSSVAVGDLNNDGFDDIVIGAPQNADGQNMAGAVYVVYSSATELTGNTSLSSVVELYGSGDNGGNGGQAGTAVATGDINGDGAADILVGTPYANPAGLSSAGWVKVIYGSTTQLTSSSLISQGLLITGETAYDEFGSNVATGDINNDGYDDLFMAAPANTDGGAPSGAVYVVYGSSSTLSNGPASSAIEITGTIANEMLGIGMAVTDTNNDGIGDLLLGNNTSSGVTGMIYVIYGQTGHLSSSTVVTAANNSFSSTTTTGDQFGRSIAVGDVNGDGFGEILIGSRGYQFLGHEGAVYLAYTSFDGDHDGVLGTEGLMNTGTDCNDADATVSANQTYYPDVDGDGLGDSTSTPESVCSSTPSTGFVSDSSDTNDTMPDGTNLVSIESGPAGTIIVTDQTGEHTYTIYASTSTKDTDVEQYEDTGYGIVRHKKGKKVYLVNLFTGAITDTVTIKKAGFSKSDMLLKDLRNNNKDEVIVTGKTKAKVTVVIVKVNSATGALRKTDSEKILNKKVAVTKTKATSTKIKLRSSKGKTLEVFNVTKKYTLKHI